MNRLARQILLLFMAAWMPFCCCQARALAQMIAHAPHGASAGCCTGEAPSCCRESTEDDCCGGGDEDPPADHGNCCPTCKDRVAPAAAPDTIDHAPKLDALGTMLLAEFADAAQGDAHTASAERDTGPPPRPSGRDALSLHSILVI